MAAIKTITNKERFLDVLGYAPSTVPAPQYKDAADVSVFRKDKSEKVLLKEMKSEHKRDLLRQYPNGVGKHLNIPSKELSKSTKFQF